jgi:hypothetical protein
MRETKRAARAVAKSPAAVSNGREVRRLARSREFARLIAQETAPLVAEQLARIMSARGSLTATGISPRAGKEETWRDDNDSQGPTAPINMESDSESTWSMNEASKLLSRLRRGSKRKK